MLIKVILLEKNNSLGEKLLITGGGRCNLTNAEFDTRKFLSKFKKLLEEETNTKIQQEKGKMEKLLETPSKRGFPTEGGVESVGLGVKNDGFPIVFSKDPQLFRLRRCEVVEGFSIRFGNIHIQIVIGDDADGITGNV